MTFKIIQKWKDFRTRQEILSELRSVSINLYDFNFESQKEADNNLEKMKSLIEQAKTYNNSTSYKKIDMNNCEKCYLNLEVRVEDELAERQSYSLSKA